MIKPRQCYNEAAVTMGHCQRFQAGSVRLTPALSPAYWYSVYTAASAGQHKLAASRLVLSGLAGFVPTGLSRPA